MEGREKCRSWRELCRLGVSLPSHRNGRLAEWEHQSVRSVVTEATHNSLPDSPSPSFPPCVVLSVASHSLASLHLFPPSPQHLAFPSTLLRRSFLLSLPSRARHLRCPNSGLFLHCVRITLVVPNTAIPKEAGITGNESRHGVALHFGARKEHETPALRLRHISAVIVQLLQRDSSRVVGPRRFRATCQCAAGRNAHETPHE